jgi:hypothetical protein
MASTYSARMLAIVSHPFINLSLSSSRPIYFALAARELCCRSRLGTFTRFRDKPLATNSPGSTTISLPPHRIHLNLGCCVFAWLLFPISVSAGTLHLRVSRLTSPLWDTRRYVWQQRSEKSSGYVREQDWRSIHISPKSRPITKPFRNIERQQTCQQGSSELCCY